MRSIVRSIIQWIKKKKKKAFRALKGLLKYPVLNINLFIVLYKFIIVVIDTIVKKAPRLFLITPYSLYFS